MVDYGNTVPRTVAGVARRMDTAGILFRRWIGCWIDMVALAALLFIPAWPISALGAPPIVSWIGTLAMLAYFPVTEGLWGRSLGKLVTGLVVVDASGQMPGLLRAAGRTVTRLVEVNPLLLGGLPAGLIVAFNPNRQRLGDMLAGTYVIPAKDLARVQAGIDEREASIFD